MASEAAVRATFHELVEARRARPTDEGAGAEAPSPLDLVAEVAHDFRSPLTSILFLADTLIAGHSGPVTEQQRSQLRLIYAAALGLLSVANDAMEMSQAGIPLTAERPTPFSVHEVLESVRQMAEPMADEKGVELRMVLSGCDRCIGRPLALGRVLLNLVTNGLRFTQQGYVELSARRVDEGAVEFAVRDTGPGIAPEARPRLFKPFRRAMWREGWLFSGTGLGLSIVRDLVASMDSELHLETGPDRGTRFHFRVPLPPADEIT